MKLWQIIYHLQGYTCLFFTNVPVVIFSNIHGSVVAVKSRGLWDYCVSVL